jgi:ATP-binding protein involved in chromosome partitioning
MALVIATKTVIYWRDHLERTGSENAMTQTRDNILSALASVAMPDGGDLASRDMIRALNIDGGTVSFLIEAPSAAEAARMEPQRRAAEVAVAALDGVEKVSVILTAHSAPAPSSSSKPAPGGEAPQLRVGGHPTPQQGPEAVPGVKKVIAIASGKGGVGKSTVTSNLAVALARMGKKVGLLDADVLGPSQPLMMGTSDRPQSADGKVMEPVEAHGVKLISIGLFLDPDQAVVWRGPMLTGTLQQFLFKVTWGELDVLLIDLPPGTGDVQLTLAQKVKMTGALVVSTPQDVALIDAHKAIDMFQKVNVPVLGLIENMSMYVCPNCGHEDHIFGQGGVRAEAEKTGLPMMGSIPLAREVRSAGDAGAPIALGEGPVADAYRDLAKSIVDLAGI